MTLLRMVSFVAGPSRLTLELCGEAHPPRARSQILAKAITAIVERGETSHLEAC